jgi:UDP-N-acetylglucosamine--N-acetylmuramyl-(pentapeptide) pyrophosphoryl-undecaprenol N-acetylglucosamine transferase
MSIKPKKILFTGGGSAGHVTPNLALIEKFQKENWEIAYIGSETGIEKELITKLGVPYYHITTGKLRRYFSLQNFIDPFKVLYGIFQAMVLCFKLKPSIVFSKGGFVSLPVVVGAWLLRIPVIIHESDLTIGLTNKLCFPLATKICVTFPETINQVANKNKGLVTGTPIRKKFFTADADAGRLKCELTSDKKTILVFGGSLGAEKINEVIHSCLPKLLENYQIVHITGKNNIDHSLTNSNYKQFEYLHEDFPNVLAAADIVISRSGANSVYELIATRKPNILLPLSKSASRGDQIINATYCYKKGFSEIIFSDQLTADNLLKKIVEVEEKSQTMTTAMAQFEIPPTINLIYGLAETIVLSIKQ